LRTGITVGEQRHADLKRIGHGDLYCTEGLWIGLNGGRFFWTRWWTFRVRKTRWFLDQMRREIC